MPSVESKTILCEWVEYEILIAVGIETITHGCKSLKAAHVVDECLPLSEFEKHKPVYPPSSKQVSKILVPSSIPHFQ